MALTSEAMTLDMRCSNCGKVDIAYLRERGEIPTEAVNCPQCGKYEFRAYDLLESERRERR